MVIVSQNRNTPFTASKKRGEKMSKDSNILHTRLRRKEWPLYLRNLHAAMSCLSETSVGTIQC